MVFWRLGFQVRQCGDSVGLGTQKMQLGMNLKVILSFQVIGQDAPLGNAVRAHLKETVLERGGPEEEGCSDGTR